MAAPQSRTHGFKKGWIILDSITHISCHMYRHSKVPLHHVLILHQKPGGISGGEIFVSMVVMDRGKGLTGGLQWFPGKSYNNTCCNKHYQVFILIYKYIRSFPLGPQRMQGHTEQDQANTKSVRGGVNGWDTLYDPVRDIKHPGGEVRWMEMLPRAKQYFIYTP